MPLHTIKPLSEDTAFVDGMPVGFSTFDPEAQAASAIDLLDPPAETDHPWLPIAEPVAAKDEEDYDDDDDDDFEDDEDDDLDDDDEDPFILDDDEDDDF
jgi:hypothetical protein